MYIFYSYPEEVFEDIKQFMVQKLSNSLVSLWLKKYIFANISNSNKQPKYVIKYLN